MRLVEAHRIPCPGGCDRGAVYMGEQPITVDGERRVVPTYEDPPNCPECKGGDLHFYAFSGPCPATDGAPWHEQGEPCLRCRGRPKWCPAGRVAVACPRCGGWGGIGPGPPSCDCRDGYLMVAATDEDARWDGARALRIIADQSSGLGRFDLFAAAARLEEGD